MQPTLITFVGLLSIVDALAITTASRAAGRAGFMAPAPTTTSTSTSSKTSTSAKTSTTSTTVANANGGRAGFGAPATSQEGRAGFPAAAPATSSKTTTKPATTTTSQKTSTTSAKPTTTTTSIKTSTTLMKTSTTTTAAATPTAVGTVSAKRGLCWPWNNPASTFNLFSPSHETWLYNWEMWSPLGGTSFASAQYVGMVRDPSRLEQIAWYYTPTSQASPYLLGFNEPDLPGDTYVTVADAVTAWKQYFLPLRKSYGTILGAPAVTNAVASNWGIDWLNQFNAACQDTVTTPGSTRSCFDFIPIHWYGYNFADFQAYVVKFHNAYPSYPIWITEFAFTDRPLDATAILSKQAVDWLDTQSYVARYSMFGPMNAANMAGITGGAMVTDDLSALTNVGKVYHGSY